MIFCDQSHNGVRTQLPCFHILYQALGLIPSNLAPFLGQLTAAFCSVAVPGCLPITTLPSDSLPERRDACKSTCVYRHNHPSLYPRRCDDLLVVASLSWTLGSSITLPRTPTSIASVSFSSFIQLFSFLFLFHPSPVDQLLEASGLLVPGAQVSFSHPSFGQYITYYSALLMTFTHRLSFLVLSFIYTSSLWWSLSHAALTPGTLPLAVRSPYLNCWESSQSNEFPALNQWPSMWSTEVRRALLLSRHRLQS